jgi:hypothetical protein
VSSYLFYIKAIWWQRQGRSFRLWFWIVPLISIAAEIGQLLNIVPGYFDPLDLLLLGMATGAIFIVEKFDRLFSEWRRI